MGPKRRSIYNEEEIMEIIEKKDNVLKRKIIETKEDNKKEMKKLMKNWEATFRKRTEELEKKHKEEIHNLKKNIEEKYEKIFQEMKIQNEPDQRGAKGVDQISQEELNRQQRQVTEVNKPMFYGNDKEQHPKDFINELEEYFRVRQIYSDEKINYCTNLSKSNSVQLVYGYLFPVKKLRRI